MNQFIQNELNEMKIQRVVGKVGLPSREYRGCQTKIRQTIDEDFILQAASNIMGEKRAQVGNVALKLGMILILAEDKELYQEVKQRIKSMGYKMPSYMKIVERFHSQPANLELFKNIIDGEFTVVSEG